MNSIEVLAFFERKPRIFGCGVIGLSHISFDACSIPIYDFKEFAPYYKFHALENLDVWERFVDTIHSFFGTDNIDIRTFGLPKLDDLVADELYDKDDSTCAEVWRSIHLRLESSAASGFAFAQKLLVDYYSKLRDDCGSNIEKAFFWYAAALGSGIIERYDDCEFWDEDEFDDDSEDCLNCGAYSYDEKDGGEYS